MKQSTSQPHGISAPTERRGFTVAIICALPVEADCVLASLDERWDDRRYGQLEGNSNAYTVGAIQGHHVVVAHMPSMGTISAAAVAAQLRMSFPNIALALVVGICGGVPNPAPHELELILGDVVFSSSIVQYDLGREYPGGFLVKNGTEDSLGRASPSIRALLNRLRTHYHRSLLETQARLFLTQIQEHVPFSADPGIDRDHLYHPSYLHRHRGTCYQCESHLICQEAIEASCEDLGCEGSYLMPRNRLQRSTTQTDPPPRPSIFFKSMASGNKVMKSAEERDRTASLMGIGAFEMEGAGAWEYIPSVVIKGVCDYADCHKSKSWQCFAAATAAACAKAFLRGLPLTPQSQNANSELASLSTQRSGTHSALWMVPFSSTKKFIGRAFELEVLERKLFESGGPKLAAIVGPAGVGKTRLALETASLAQFQIPNCSVFWVQASDALTVSRDMLEIGKALKIPGIEDEKANVKSLVHQKLCSAAVSPWLLVLDNADDTILWDSNGGLVDYVPRSQFGSVLVTTRTRRVGFNLAGHDLVELAPLDGREALELFQQHMNYHEDVLNTTETAKLLQMLGHWPLAITHAAAYITVNGCSIGDYLDLLRDSDENVIELLNEEFRIENRYVSNGSATLSTWLVSIEQIRNQNPLAASYLSLLSCLGENRVPKAIIMQRDPLKATTDALGLLKAYYLVHEQDAQLSLHNLVRLATRSWLIRDTRLSSYMSKAIHRLNEVLPHPEWVNMAMWTDYLPHALQLCKTKYCDDIAEKATLRLKVGQALILKGDYTQAVSELKLAVEWREEWLGKKHEEVWIAYDYLSYALQGIGDWNEAEKYQKYTVDQRMERLTKQHPDTLASMSNLATTYWNQGRWAEVEQLYLEVIALMTQELGAEHQRTLTAMQNLAATYRNQGRLREAEELGLKGLEIQKRLLGEDHPKTLIGMSNLAQNYRHQGRFREAELLNIKVYETQKRLLGPQHPTTLTSMNGLARSKKALGQKKEALELLKTCADMSIARLGESHPLTQGRFKTIAIWEGEQKLQLTGAANTVVHSEANTDMTKHTNR